MSEAPTEEERERMRAALELVAPAVPSFIFPQGDGAKPAIGSGALVVSAGRTFVFTAGHNLAESRTKRSRFHLSFLRKVIVPFSKAAAPRDLGPRWLWRSEHGRPEDKDPDVGYVELDPRDAALWKHIERPFTFADFDRPRDVVASRIAMMLGFPYETASFAPGDTDREPFRLDLTGLALRVDGIARADEEGLHVAYEVGRVVDRYDLDGQPSAVPKPHGMSGGPLLTVDGTEVRLIGLARGILDGTERFESVASVLKLFLDHETGEAAREAAAALERVVDA